MDIDIIRYFGAAYVMESELPPKEKCNLIDYIKEAEWDQILNLVLTGSKPDRKLTVNEQYILEAQAENHIYPLVFRYLTERKKGKKKTRKEKMAAGAEKRPSAYQRRQAKKQAGKAFDPKTFRAGPELGPDPPAVDPNRPKAQNKKKKAPKPEVVKTKGTAVRASKEAGVVPQQVKQDVAGGYRWIRGQAVKGGEAAKEVAGKIPGKKIMRGTGVLLLIAAATAAGQRVYKSYLTQAARQCKGISGPEKRNCMVKFRKAGYQAKINSYVKARADCNNSKDPARCKRILDAKIKRVKYRMNTLYSRL